MNDERMQSVLEEWFEARDAAPPDVRRSAQQVMERRPQVRQRSRWWPFPTLYRSSSAPTTTNTVDHQPNPIPANNGHTPTVIGRTQSMLSPAKAITAGAIVAAIGGVMLVAQPFQQGTTSPGAEVPPVEATWVTGTGYWAPACSGPESSEVDGDVTHERGLVCEPTRWETSDPRLNGEASWRWSADTYATDDGPKTVIYGAEYLRNDGGGWTCPTLRLAGSSGVNPSQYNVSDIQLCVGDGGYEGLTALVIWPGENTSSASLVGLVFPGDIPPMPDPPPTE